jgi:hypothetical protein
MLPIDNPFQSIASYSLYKKSRKLSIVLAQFGHLRADAQKSEKQSQTVQTVQKNRFFSSFFQKNYLCLKKKHLALSFDGKILEIGE